MQSISPRTPLSRFRNMFIGDKAFYRTAIALILPIIIQNTISGFVNLLDNVMVGQVGTLQMSGVAIANQLVFVYNLAIFGGISGAGIYGAQFVGAGDWDGYRQSFRFKLLLALALTAVGTLVMALFHSSLISLFLTGDGTPEDAAAILGYGSSYLKIILFCLLPFAISQCYGASLRETGETMLPMISSIAAVVVNLAFNYIMIFGKLGFPAMGADGAAIATCISRYVELAIIVIGTHVRKKFHFVKGLYRDFRIGKKLATEITKKSMPLLANEFFWSFGMTALTQIFSTCGLTVVASLNISSTISNLFNTFFLSMGTAVAVMVGQALGADDPVLAKKLTWKLTAFGVMITLVVASALFALAGIIPNIYNTEQSVKDLATLFMRTGACYMVFHSIAHCSYFAMRSGGKTFITMLFDSVYTWVLCVPYTYLMVRYSGLAIEALYPLCYVTDILKAVLGILVIRTGYWAKNITSSTREG